MTAQNPQNSPRRVGSDGAVFKCPACRKALPNADVPEFPFCSERCRLVDLGNWLDGKYQVSRPVEPEDPIEEMPRTVPPRPENG